MKRIYWLKHILVLGCMLIFFFGYSQKEKEVKLELDDGILAGTLLTAAEGKEAPVVLIVPGSGAMDRDGNTGFVQSNVYLLLAKGLLANGISTLCYDKLGAGKSELLIEEKDMRYTDDIQHVIGWINYLDEKGYSNIIIAGHSEGSLTGMLAAQKGKVKKFISLEGAGQAIGSILKVQLSEQLKGDNDLLQQVNQIITQLENGKKVKDIPSSLAVLFRASVQPYLMGWMKYNPQEEIAKLSIPILIVQGGHDIQVNNENAMLLMKGQPDATLKLFPEMNHILKEAPAERTANLKTYYNPDLPLYPELLETIVRFIKK